MAKKTSCPITRAQFKAKAKTITVSIGDNKYDAMAREFSTGSLGWNINAKVNLEIDGVQVPVQIGVNLTLVGSKDLPPDPAAPAPAPTPPNPE
jgi:hypothetical protein